MSSRSDTQTSKTHTTRTVPRIPLRPSLDTNPPQLFHPSLVVLFCLVVLPLCCVVVIYLNFQCAWRTCGEIDGAGEVCGAVPAGKGKDKGQVQGGQSNRTKKGTTQKRNTDTSQSSVTTHTHTHTHACPLSTVPVPAPVPVCVTVCV